MAAILDLAVILDFLKELNAFSRVIGVVYVYKSNLNHVAQLVMT